MILVKGFFRKLSSKIYLTIFIVLLTSIIVLFSFKNYYTELLNQKYREKSFMVVISDDDYYDKLNGYKKVTNVEEILTFEPGKKYDTIVYEDYIGMNDGTVIDARLTGAYSKVNWESFIAEPHSDDTFLIVLPANRYDLTLSDNEIIFALDSFTYQYEEDKLLQIKDSKVDFYYNNGSYEYTINDFVQKKIPGAIISNAEFEKLKKMHGKHAYIVELDSQEASIKLQKKIEKASNVKVINCQRQYDQDGLNSVKLMDLIDILKFSSQVVVIILCVIVLIAMKNILSDSKKNILLEKKLGYSNLQIKFYLLVELLLLISIALIVSTLFSFCINTMINMYFEFQLLVCDFKMLGTLYSSGIFVVLLICCVCRVRKYEV